MKRALLLSAIGKGVLIRALLLPLSLVDFGKGSIVLQILFGVLGILYSIAVSIAVSIDLSKVRNNIYRSRFREALLSIVSHLTVDLLLTSLFIVIGLLFEPSKIQIGRFMFTLSYSTLGILSSLRSLLFETLSFNSLLRFKDKLTERIIQEEEK